MNHLSVELLICGYWHEDKREKISIGVYEEGDFPELLERISELTKCGLDLETNVERWSD